MKATDTPIIVDVLNGDSLRHVWRDRWGWIWEWCKWGDDTYAWGRRESWRTHNQRAFHVDLEIHGPFELIGTKPEMHAMLREMGIE